MSVFRYRDQGYGMAPLLPVELQLHDHRTDLLLLVDTGAERTLLEGLHLRHAGFDVFSGRPVTFQSFAGSRTVAYLHPCRLSLAGCTLELEAAFSTQPLLREVLGRDALMHFELWVREASMEFGLSRNSGGPAPEWNEGVSGLPAQLVEVAPSLHGGRARRVRDDGLRA